MSPTVSMPDDVWIDNEVEAVPDEASTEAGKVTLSDDKGPKACASDEANPGREDTRQMDG